MEMGKAHIARRSDNRHVDTKTHRMATKDREEKAVTTKTQMAGRHHCMWAQLGQDWPRTDADVFYMRRAKQTV